MTDERPKPKYGELAPEGWVWTPPQEAVPDAPADADAPVALTGAPGRAAWGAPSAPPAAPDRPGPTPVGPAPAGRRTGDLIATVLLLALGLFSTVNSVISLLAMQGLVQQMMDLYGISGTYAATPAVTTAGAIGAVLLVVVLVVVTLISVRRLRAHKLAFFWPLIGAAASFLVTFVCLFVALASDPSILSALQNASL